MTSNGGSGFGAVGPVERRTLGEKIYESLRRAIIRGDLKPGQRVTERELAQQLNVSTTPVREAFRRLAAIGLITIVPWSGAVIEGVSKDDIAEVFQCREVLEGLACRLAARHIDDAGVECFRALISKFESEVDIAQMLQIDGEIHALVLKYSGNLRLSSIMTGINEITRFYRELTKVNLKRVQEMCNEYQEILAALSLHDGEKSEEVMRNHIRNSFEFSQASEQP